MEDRLAAKDERLPSRVQASSPGGESLGWRRNFMPRNREKSVARDQHDLVKEGRMPSEQERG